MPHPADHRLLASARLIAACLSLAAGAAAASWWAVGDRSVDGPGLTPVFGPFHVPVSDLRAGGVIALLLAIGGVAVLGRAAARRDAAPGWWLVAAAYGALGAISGWEWRLLTAAVFGPETLLVVSAVVAVVAWTALFVWSAACAGRTNRSLPRARGCSYCAQDVHLTLGDVQQLAATEDGALILLGCPRCGWFYCTSLDTGHDVVAISEAQARETFQNTW